MQELNKQLLKLSNVVIYPQLRIDCEANRKFEAPLHKDGFILGKELKGIVVRLPSILKGIFGYNYKSR